MARRKNRRDSRRKERPIGTNWWRWAGEAGLWILRVLVALAPLVSCAAQGCGPT